MQRFRPSGILKCIFRFTSLSAEAKITKFFLCYQWQLAPSQYLIGTLMTSEQFIISNTLRRSFDLSQFTFCKKELSLRESRGAFCNHAASFIIWKSILLSQPVKIIFASLYQYPSSSSWNVALFRFILLKLAYLTSSIASLTTGQ